MKTTGKVTGIVSNLVTVEVDGPVAQNELCYIDLNGVKLMAEVIKVNGTAASVQVYESTRGLKVGCDVEFEGRMLEVTLGPGLLSSNYDGLQDNLATMQDVFLKRGEYTPALDSEKKWEFTPIAKPGDKVVAADWLGEVKEGWLGPMLSYMESHPEVAACHPKVRCQWAPEYFEYAGAAGGYIDALGYPYCRGRVFGTIEKDLGQYDEVATVLWAAGASLFIRCADYWAVGGLDGRFFAHQEEIDLCWRLRSRGRGVVCIPQSVIYHLGGGTLPQGNPKKEYLNFRNNLLLLYKNLPEDRLRSVMRWRFWLDALASLQFALKGEFRSALAVWKGRRDFYRLRPQFEPDRRENQRLATLSPVPEQSHFSLLWQYYVKGRKTFRELKEVDK